MSEVLNKIFQRYLLNSHPIPPRLDKEVKEKCPQYYHLKFVDYITDSFVPNHNVTLQASKFVKNLEENVQEKWEGRFEEYGIIL